MKTFKILLLLLFSFVFLTNFVTDISAGAPPGPEVYCVANNPDERTSESTSGKIATAIGCIPIFNIQGTSVFILRWGIGIGGGIALILIVISGYMITTSSGDPRRLQAGKELLTAAVSGLFFLISAAYLFRIIGVEILRLPGF